MVDYTRLAGTVAELIATYGRSVTLTQVASSFDALTLTTSEATTSHDMLAVVMPASARTALALDSGVETGTLVASDLRSLLMPASAGVIPRSGDRFTFDGLTWTALGASPLYPGGTPLIYRVTVKR
ncbi:MAG: hypothetical protein ACPGO3_09950 [Magnetospiraceae bacterium]